MSVVVLSLPAIMRVSKASTLSSVNIIAAGLPSPWRKEHSTRKLAFVLVVITVYEDRREYMTMFIPKSGTCNIM